jgi:hypothetical protein
MTESRHEPTVIDLDDETDRLAWRCPRGHAHWEPTNSHFYCRSCAHQSRHDDDLNPTFDELRNDATGETVPREELRLRTELGDWRDVRGARERSA